MYKFKEELSKIPKSWVALFVAFWTPVIVFSKLAGEVLEGEPIRFDHAILFWIHARATPLWDKLFLFITTVGNVEVLGPVSLLVTAWLFYKKQKTDAFIVGLSVGGAAAANVLLKLLFHRARPALWPSLIVEHSYSFPSGHAMISSAFILSVIFTTRNKSYKWLVRVVGLLLIALIGLSRIYLGVHYPSDVLAGWSVGLAWVVVVVVGSKSLNMEVPTSVA